MSDDDLNYFEGRARTELEMTQRSQTPEVTAVHYNLAEVDFERVDALRGSAPTEPGGPGVEAPVDAEAAAAGLPERRGTKSGEGAEP